MKILILANNVSGLYQFRKELIDELLKLQNEIVISCPQGEYADIFKEKGCKYIITPIDRRGTSIIKDYKLLKTYKKILKEEFPNIVLTYTIKPNVYGGIACQKLHIPYIANITGLGTSLANSGILQRISLFLLRRGLRKATKVFFQNKPNKDFLLKRNIIKCSCEVLPGSGVNLAINSFEEYPDETNQTVFVTIGRIMRDKGSDELLKAVKIIKKEYDNIVFQIVGAFDGKYEKKVKDAVADGTIKYLGYRQDIHEIIKNSNATIHPSYHEGTSNVLLETAACGRPIIASDVPGCNNTFDDGVSGIAFKSKNVNSLVEAIKKFLALSYDERRQMGVAGRKKVEKEFDRQIVIDAYLREIKKIEE